MKGETRPLWGSRLAFIIAATGSAVGLGNIWKFPFVAGMNGGGAFVLVYLITISLVCLPLMAAEIFIGKSTHASPVVALARLAGQRSPWRLVGLVAMLAPFLILSFYSVVSGWTLHYLFLSLRNAFAGQSPEAIQAIFGSLYGSPGLNLLWHLVVMVISTFIVYWGVRHGIERATKVLMPVLLGLLLVLLINSFLSPGFGEAVRFLLQPDFSKLTPAVVLSAVGHGFFSLSLGMGAMITYGSYLAKESDIVRPALAIVVADTGIALLAGLVLFPIVFSYGFTPDQGTGLVFKILPVAFSRMPGGAMVSLVFFLLLFVAALTSLISLLEVLISYFVDRGILPRHMASVATGAAVFLLGILSALSGSTLAEVEVPGFKMNLFDSLDYLASNWLLPLGGFFVAIFVGWFAPAALRKEELERNAPSWWSYSVWLFVLRFITPVGLLFVFLHAVGIL